MVRGHTTPDATDKHRGVSVTPRTYEMLKLVARQEGVAIGKLIERMIDRAEAERERGRASP